MTNDEAIKTIIEAMDKLEKAKAAMEQIRAERDKSYACEAIGHGWGDAVSFGDIREGDGMSNYSEIPTGSTTKNDLGVDLDKLIADCEKMSFYFELFGKPMKAVALDAVDAVKNIVKDLLSVTPQEPKCKDCKWWKDSDGEYRRGCGAESICRINTDKVYQGEGYCYMFEPQKSEKA